MTLGAAYAKGKWALGECARSGRKMLLRNMVADGYYPNLIVDPEWYEPKHPQESLPKVRDPTALYRPAPERDRINVLVLFDGSDFDTVPGGGFGKISGFGPSSISFGYGLRAAGFVVTSEPGVDFFPSFDSISNYDTQNQQVTLSGGGNRVDAFWFKPDGTLLITVDQSTDTVHEWNLSTAYLLSSAIIGNNFSLPAAAFVLSITFSPDGTSFWIVSGGGTTDIQQFTMTTAWDITTASLTGSFNIVNMSDTPVTITIASDGSRVVSGNADSTNFFEYDMSSAFDITSMTQGSTEAQSESTTVFGAFLHGAGNKLYFAERSGLDRIHEYDITGFDITTRSAVVSTSIDYGPVVGHALEDWQMNPDGSELFMCRPGSVGTGQFTSFVP